MWHWKMSILRWNQYRYSKWCVKLSRKVFIFSPYLLLPTMLRMARDWQSIQLEFPSICSLFSLKSLILCQGNLCSVLTCIILYVFNIIKWFLIIEVWERFIHSAYFIQNMPFISFIIILEAFLLGNSGSAGRTTMNLELLVIK